MQLKKRLLPTFFSPLLSSLSADNLVMLINPIVVYAYTESLSLSGGAYALEWLVRIILIPLIGKKIDQFGIRSCSIFFDIIRIIMCIFLTATLVFQPVLSHVSFAFLLGFFGGVISVSNAQIIIVYEKFIVITQKHSNEIEGYSNLITIADQVAMILGSIVGIIAYKFCGAGLFLVPIPFYIINLVFFLRQSIKESKDEKNPPPQSHNINMRKIRNLYFVTFIAALAFSNFFSNIIDGLVEASGSYIIQEKNKLPLELYVLINIISGFIGVLFSQLLKISIAFWGENRSFVLFSLFEFFTAILLSIFFFNFYLLLMFYSLCIGSKVATITLKRVMRMKAIKEQQFAFVSSLLISFSQLALPIIGGILYFSQDGNLFDIRYIVLFSAIIVLAASLSSLHYLKKHLSI